MDGLRSNSWRAKTNSCSRPSALGLKLTSEKADLKSPFRGPLPRWHPKPRCRAEGELFQGAWGPVWGEANPFQFFLHLRFGGWGRREAGASTERTSQSSWRMNSDRGSRQNNAIEMKREKITLSLFEPRTRSVSTPGIPS